MQVSACSSLPIKQPRDDCGGAAIPRGDVAARRQNACIAIPVAAGRHPPTTRLMSTCANGLCFGRTAGSKQIAACVTTRLFALSTLNPRSSNNAMRAPANREICAPLPDNGPTAAQPARHRLFVREFAPSPASGRYYVRELPCACWGQFSEQTDRTWVTSLNLVLLCRHCDDSPLDGPAAGASKSRAANSSRQRSATAPSASASLRPQPAIGSPNFDRENTEGIAVLVRRWTPAEDALLRKLIIEGHSAAEIATELKRSLPSVKSRAHQIGIPLGFYRSKPTRRFQSH